jgi:hypothetical protein
MESGENKLISISKVYKLSELFFIILAGTAIITSALHFWPFEDRKIWQMFNAPNICCIIALVAASFLFMSKKGRRQVITSFPHISVIAYLTISILSISFADGLSRTLNYTLKLALVFLGGFFLFQSALSKPKALNIIYTFIIIAVSLSISVCIYTRLMYNPTQFGFHSNVFKYGTYIGIFVPLSGMYLLSGSKLQVLLGILITAAGFFSAGSAGAILAIFAGFLTGLVLIKKRSVRCYIFICILISASILPLSNKLFYGAVYQDFALKETDLINLRQRYIEWQAEINLLEERGIIGTGPGCINDYRSNFYYRLPKLNTLKAFDQNCFLAIAAETGLLGLVAFIWIIIYYGRTSFKDHISMHVNEISSASRMATANTAAFVSALVANLFSSVHYNGILIIFVLLLSLISSVNRIYGECVSEI